MKKLGMGVGSKIFIWLHSPGAHRGGHGAAGFLSLGKVTTAGNVNVSSEECEAKSWKRESLRKSISTKRMKNSYAKLVRCLDELAALTSGLEAGMGQSGEVGQIAAAQQDYKQAMTEIRKLEEDDAKAMKDLQNAGMTLTPSPGMKLQRQLRPQRGNS